MGPTEQIITKRNLLHELKDVLYKKKKEVKVKL